MIPTFHFHGFPKKEVSLEQTELGKDRDTLVRIRTPHPLNRVRVTAKGNPVAACENEVNEQNEQDATQDFLNRSGHAPRAEQSRDDRDS